MKSIFVFVLLGLVSLLSACGKEPESESNEYDALYESLTNAKASKETLESYDADAMLNHYKNGLRLYLSNQYRWFSGSGSSSSTSGSGTGADAPTGGFSSTNVHENGVDEADIIKYDGEYMYVSGGDFFSMYPGGTFSIVKTDPEQVDAHFVGEYTDETFNEVSGMYLIQEAGKTTDVVLMKPEFAGLQIVNIEDPALPVLRWSVNIEGHLIESRQIGDTLYLLTIKDIYQDIGSFERESVGENDSHVRSLNETKLEALTFNDIFPHYTIGDKRALLATSCLLEKNTASTVGFTSVVNLTAIDLKDRKISSQCIGGDVDSFSLSSNEVYLAKMYETGDDKEINTVIHKFELSDNGPEYAATGSVRGGIPTLSDAAFSFNAFDDELRVVTTIDRDIHHLHILEQQDNILNEVSVLPNEERPTRIGKENEAIYSVRFDGDTAYIVTYGQPDRLWVDPLYTIDLSNSLDPKIVSELDLPGFATYMHPLGDKHLFTLGRDTDEETGELLAMKAELFDVSVSPAVLIDTVFLDDPEQGRVTSDALQNLRAISFLQDSNEQLRIGIPYNEDRFTNEVSPPGVLPGRLPGLYMLEVNGLDGDQPHLSSVGEITAEAYNPSIPSGAFIYPFHQHGRGVLTGDTVYLSYSGGVWAAPWGRPDETVGPIMDEDCNGEDVAALEVTIRGIENNDKVSLCDTKITVSVGDFRELLSPVVNEFNSEQCVFRGAIEQGGTLRVYASITGADGISHGETVRAKINETVCHVQTQYLDIEMDFRPGF